MIVRVQTCVIVETIINYHDRLNGPLVYYIFASNNRYSAFFRNFNSDVSRDVTHWSRGVVYFCGWQKHDVAQCFLLNLLPKKRVRGENAGELLRNKLYKSVHKCIGNDFF